MIRLSGACTIDGKNTDIAIPSAADFNMSAAGLTIFPGLIDPHVHFRTPGMEHKEDWRTAAKAALHGGYTTVFDMPNTLPPTVTAALLKDKIALINAQLKEVGIPLRYHLYFGADKHHLSQIHLVKKEIIGIKIFMGCSTGNLVIDDDESLHAVFAIAATQNLLVAVHAEDEARIKQRKIQFHGTKNYHDHSNIRDIEVAALAVEKAIDLARIYGTRLYILHVSSREEINIIKQAKADGLPVFAETTPHHLFLNDSFYPLLQGRAVVNPPLRPQEHQADLFKAIREGVIDTIGSDHAPHLSDEKAKPYGECPSGMPGIETTLPLLLTAYHQGLITLEHVVRLTSTRAQEIFQLEKNEDVTLVDLNQQKIVSGASLKTKCAWSAFEGQTLRGWPTHVIMQGQFFDLSTL